jgi:hypothetical protein
MNCCICGPVKNCATYLQKIFENIEKIGSLFNDYKIVIFYDKSIDNTLDILKEYQKINPRLFFYVNEKPISPFRTHRIAFARNFCLQYVKDNKDLYSYFIMMDLDDVNTKNLNIEPLKKSLLRNDWDGLSFNTYPHYYDIWALSIWPYCFSYNHFYYNFQYHKIIRAFIMNKLLNLKYGELLPCISSFNGFSIYRTNKFLNSYYDGRVRTDLFPKSLINAHSNAQKSRGIVYRDYGHIKGKYEDCEHRSFHQMARINANARIRISPEILFN